MLIKEELETYKDIIVNFWDGEYFFKVTDGQKPMWYTSGGSFPNPYTGRQMFERPLADLLTGDYFIKVDISSALRPNKERRKQELINILTFMINPALQAILQSQGKQLNIEEISKVAREFGLNPESLFIDFQRPMVPGNGRDGGSRSDPGRRCSLTGGIAEILESRLFPGITGTRDTFGVKNEFYDPEDKEVHYKQKRMGTRRI